MKNGIIAFILLFTHSVLSQDYLMPQLVMKKNLEDKSDINSPPNANHCQGSSLFQWQNNDENGFEATIKCHFSCQNSAPINKELIQNFSTGQLSMQRGDGNLWASLTTTIQMWSSEQCLKIAQSECKSLDKISEFTQPEISSGEWKLENKLGCSQKMKEILSPFEKSIKTQKTRRSYENTSIQLEIKSNWHDIKQVTHGGRKYKMPKGCKNIIKGEFCYGDCITLDKGPTKELLASPAPLGEDKYEICADELVSKLKGKKLSKDIIQFYCDDFFLYSLKKKSATGLTCASSRINADCTGLKL